MLVAALAAAATSCIEVPPTDPQNRPPTVLLEDRTVYAGEAVSLPSGGMDPDGDLLAYHWTLAEAPPSSHAALDDAAAEEVVFVSDRLGDYVVNLVASDGELSVEASAVVTAVLSADAPAADAGADQTVAIDTMAVLSGAGSTSSAGLPLGFRWELISAPKKSAASLVGQFGEVAELEPDVEGEYVVELVVHDSAYSSAPDEVVVTAIEPVGQPEDVANGIFDPGEVYLFGTVEEGLCGRMAIADLADPDVAAAGFGCDADERSAVIGRDGTMLFVDVFDPVIRQFVCDGCPSWEPGMPYPADPYDNDGVIDVPNCPSADTFLLGPGGEVLANCGPEWRTAAGEPVDVNGGLWSYGNDGKLLTTQGRVVDLATQGDVPVVGLPPSTSWLTTRVRPGGFHVVVDTAESTELWFVGGDGEGALVGTYPPFPIGYQSSFAAALDATGRLYEEALILDSLKDAIVRRSIDGPSEVVYTEATDPPPGVLFHAGALVTGP